MEKKDYDSKLSELLGARIEAFGNYTKEKKKFKEVDKQYDKEAHEQRKKALEQLKKDGTAKEEEEKEYLKSIERNLSNKEKLSEEELSSFKLAKQSILLTQNEYNKQLADATAEEKKLTDLSPIYEKKWKKIAEDTKGYTDAVNGALTNMFGATTKYMERKKEMMQAELAEINKMLEEAQKDVAAKTLEIANVKKKAQEEIDKKFKINHSDTNEEKDKKEADREAAYAEIEELQNLYDLKQQMATENAQHENGIGNQEKQLTAEQVARFDTLSGEHSGYVASLDKKTEAQKTAQYKEAELNTKKKKTEADIKKNDKQKQKVEAAQQYIAATVNIAQGVTKAWGLGPIIGPILAAVVGAAGAVQLGYMHAQINKLEDGGLLRGKRHSTGGMRILGSNIEVEGGEYVVNRESTDKNLGLIRYINSQRRQLAPTDLSSFFAKSAQGFEPPFRRALELGGQLPQIQSPMNIDNELLMQAIRDIKFEPKVSVTDINTAQTAVVQVDAWTGM